MRAISLSLWGEGGVRGKAPAAWNLLASAFVHGGRPLQMAWVQSVFQIPGSHKKEPGLSHYLTISPSCVCYPYRGRNFGFNIGPALQKGRFHRQDAKSAQTFNEDWPSVAQ